MRPRILMIAGFGDNSSMYAPLTETRLADDFELIPINLPGFGASPLAGDVSLKSLARFVSQAATDREADILMAHSVASIIASFAANEAGSRVTRILSLEGNLTADDAYFSATAANFPNPDSFRAWFLPKLSRKAGDDPIIGRYLDAVARCDPRSLWQLGCDAKSFSDHNHPGELLAKAAHSTYLYNSENCAAGSIEWLAQSQMEAIELPGASHWPTIDQPHELANAISAALS